ncbi:hypothetical protein Ae201684P_018129 [Aphanomyces euteiches]|uniref:Uncharacterized protein n=1 Tax=Aphanomyces euteiches TaxID=100861 RepID=A0A6G0X3D2_9STRA|nr:hypothetical protein Ae201684_008887 [Aphanomyces euteiches]KAH9054408.1 hypothetical protein Ae201684P_018129 [Aphanomyces euteiches]
MAASKCCFGGCTNDAFVHGKCRFHRYRHFCSVDKCMNQAYARRLCVSHGGRRECKTAGCTGNARSRGYCCKHSLRPSSSATDHTTQHRRQLMPCQSSTQINSSGSPAPSSSTDNSTSVDERSDSEVETLDMHHAANQLKLIEVSTWTEPDNAAPFPSCLPFDVTVVDGFLSEMPMSIVWSLKI